MILFQIKVFGRNIKEATLARCFIKATARPSFTLFRVIRRINGKILKWKISYKDSVVSSSYLNLLDFFEAEKLRFKILKKVFT